MEWFDDLILIVAGKDKPTVSLELLNTRSEKELYIGSGIVCLIDNDDLVLRLTSERYRRRKVLGIIPNSVKKTPLIRSVNDIVICP